MSYKASQFPKRLQGIWRSGSMRPNEIWTTPVELPSAGPRRDRYRKHRGDSSAAVDPVTSQTDGPPELGAVVSTLAERLRLHVERASAKAAETKQAQASGQRETASAAPRRRRSGFGALIRTLIILGFFAFFFSRQFDIDIEEVLQAALTTAEQALSEATGEAERAVEVGHVASVETASTTTASSLVRNGGFESPPLQGNTDNTLPAHWQFVGEKPYSRIRSASSGYPRAPDGVAMLSVHGQRRGTLYQNLVPMEAGVTYTFRAIVLHSSGDNAYRAAFWRVEQDSQRELAFISEQQVSPPDHDGFPVSFSYTASADDAGKLLRLQLSDNGSRRKSRSAFDAVTVRAER